MSESEVRVRIAPSPTGNLHVGTARTALFNYLFAKGHGGKYILRIEDTDTERSKDEYTQNIYDSLRALGIVWDEGPDVGGPYAPYSQMERLDLYRNAANKLLEADLAYYAYETQEELEAQRNRAKSEGRAYVYERPSKETREAQSKDPSRTKTLRFKIPDNTTQVVVSDHVRGDVTFDTSLIGDFVIMKSNGTPTYNFAVVVDDVLMKITHIIRGEDHISNTPRQILIYQALHQVGLAPEKLPELAHVGMILAPDKSKLSKRHGATAVSEFVAKGYLPEAFCNFLTLLGWSAPDGQEVATLEHFASQFELSRIAQSPAVFEMDKLNWLNKQYMRDLPIEEFLNRAQPYLKDFDLSAYEHDKLLTLLDAVREPITTLSDLPDAVDYFFTDTLQLDQTLVDEVLMTEESRVVLKGFEATVLPTMDFSSSEALSEAVKTYAKSLKPMKMKTVMWAIRVALTSRTHWADMGKLLYVLGKDTIAQRISAARTLIGEPTQTPA